MVAKKKYVKPYIRMPSRCENPAELPMSLDEIGQSLGLSRERVRQILASAMYKVRRELRKRGLEFEDIV